MELQRTADQVTASNLAFELSDAEVATLGGSKRPPVVLTVNGVSIRARVAPMGGCNLIGITKANRAVLGLEAGTTYAIEVTLDTAERTVEVPADLTAAFADQPELRAAWDAWSFTRRREAAASITEAKRPETRAKRLAVTLDALRG